MFPRAPTCVLRSRPFYAGEPGRVEIELEAEQDTRIKYIDATASIDEGWVIGGGNNRVSNAITLPVGRWRLAGPGVLPAGTNRYLVDLVTPVIGSPSHEHAPAYVRLIVYVHVSIPWWPDGRYRFTVKHRIRPPASVVRTPVAITSAATTSSARLEIALASSRVIAGEALVGSCALFHMDDREPREVAVAFVPKLRLVGRWRDRDDFAAPLTATVTIPAGGAGTNVPFALQLPPDMTPSFTGSTHSLSWFLNARAGSFFGAKAELVIPLEIVDSGALASTARLEAAPTLAEERAAVLFTKFAQDYGWRVDEHDHTGAVSVVRELDGGAELHLSYDYRGEQGTFLVSRIVSRSLGLGLLVTPASAIRHVFFHDIEVDVAGWDRDHLVKARDAAQAVPALRPVVDAMVATAGLGRVQRWTDEELVFERPIINPDARDLRAIGDELGRVAAAIEVGRGAITPPFEVDLDAWRELARWLHGGLSVGDLSIAGTLAQAPVRLGLTFDERDRPFSMRVSVGDPATTSEAAKAIALTLARPAHDALHAPLALTELLLHWPAERTDLVIDNGVASASLPPASVDAASVRALVESLRALVSALAPEAGPYR